MYSMKAKSKISTTMQQLLQRSLRTIGITCLVLLLVMLTIGQTNAQLANQLNKTVDGIATVRNASTLLDSLFFTSTYSQAVFDIIASLQKYGKQAGNYNDISAALTAAIVDTSTLIVSERHSITTNTTLSGVSSLFVIRNGVFNITSGDTLTISVPFRAGLYQVFEGAGVVQFTDGSVPVVEVEWFGSGQAGVNKAIQSLTASGGNVRFSKAISITDSILIDKHNTHFYGSGHRGGDIGANITAAYISIASGSSDGIVVTGGNCLLENFTIDGLAVKNGDDGIRLETLSTLREIQILRMGGNGIRMGQDSNNMNGWFLENIFSFNNDSNGVYIHDGGGGLPDTNAGAAFFLFCKGNGLDGLRLENTLDNQFYMYRGDTNTGYGIRLKSSAKGNFFTFPYMEANTTGTGIIDLGADQNFILGTRQGTGDLWTDNGVNNVIMGRENSLNQMYMFKGNVAFDSLHIGDVPFNLSGIWRMYKSAGTRDLHIEKALTSANANVVIRADVNGGIVNLTIEDGVLSLKDSTGGGAEIGMDETNPPPDNMVFY